jgi:O-antigen ligase
VSAQALDPFGGVGQERQAGGFDIAAIVARLELATVCVLIFMFSNALFAPLLDPDQKAGDSQPLLRLMWLPAYAAILGLAALRWRQMVKAWLPALLTFAITGFVISSILWSIEPDVTLRRGVALFATTVFGLYLGARYSWRALVNILAGSFTFLAVLSLLFVVGMPSFGVHHGVNDGDWRGLWYEKNELGAMMTQGVLANLVSAVLSRSRMRWVWLACAVLCLGMVVKAHAGTSYLCTLIVLAGVPGLMLVRRGGVLAVLTLWLGGVAVGAVAAVAALGPELVLKALGKDPTLTGRTEIWEALFRRLAERPTLGYGFAAFWNNPQGPAAFIRKETGWVVPNAHNGWLDLLVQVGWVGVTLVAVYIVLAYGAALVRAFHEKDGGYAPVFMTTLLVLSFSESVILTYNALKWVIFLAVFTKVWGTPLPWRKTDKGPSPAVRWRAPAAPDDDYRGGDVVLGRWEPGIR